MISKYFIAMTIPDWMTALELAQVYGKVTFRHNGSGLWGLMCWQIWGQFGLIHGSINWHWRGWTWTHCYIFNGHQHCTALSLNAPCCGQTCMFYEGKSLIILALTVHNSQVYPCMELGQHITSGFFKFLKDYYKEYRIIVNFLWTFSQQSCQWAQSYRVQLVQHQVFFYGAVFICNNGLLVVDPRDAFNPPA